VPHGFCRHCGNRPRGAKLVALAKRTNTAAGSRNFPAADRGASGLPSKQKSATSQAKGEFVPPVDLCADVTVNYYFSTVRIYPGRPAP
jgi:hypothetical protein